MTESNEPRELLPCPTLRDALREWRMGLPMLLRFALVGLAMRIF